ncbi:cell division protein FtsQ/DivIB [Senegalia massiliensis]|uniref:cell division protein FtsQ/DivIB n=1 Tax=Senegalia massiliensis TaxID=1720316 RepID=UPI0013EF2F08|nr:FtsQ-type POTRA domain-containing protein [Senegalia massiliensis]
MEKKYKVDKKIKKKRVLVMTMIILLLISLLFFILFTQTTLFHIKNIDIKGKSELEDEKIILASGIVKGENIFKINKKTIVENLTNHPYIKAAKVDMKLPDTVVVNIQERREVIVYNNNGNYIYIDKEGFVLNTLSKLKNKNIPLLETTQSIEYELNKKINFKNNNYISEVLKLLNNYNKEEYSYEISKIIEQEKNTTLVLNSGINVALDGLNDIKYKLEFIEKIVKDLDEKDISAKQIKFDKGKNPIVIK